MPPARPFATQLKRLHLSVFFASIGIAYVYLVPAFAQQIGANYLDLGLIGTIRSLPYAFLPVIAGYFGDRVGKSRLYLLSVFVVAFATLLVTMTHTIQELLAVQLLFGIGLSFFWPISEALVSEISPVQERASAIGIYAVSWGSGFLIGPLIGGIIADAAGFHSSFLVAGVLILITAAGSVAAIRGEPERQGNTRQPSTRPTRKLISSVLPMLIVQIPYAFVLAFVVSIFPGYAVESGLTLAEVGLLLSGFGFTRTAVFSLAGKMSRIGERKSIGFAFLGMVVVLILMPSNRSFVSLLADSCLLGMFIGIIYPQTIAYVSKRSPTESLGFAIGAYETVFGIGFTVGPILSGFVAQISGVNFALLVLAGITLAIIPVLAFPRKSGDQAA